MLQTRFHQLAGVLLSAAASFLLLTGTAAPLHADMTTKSDAVGDAPPRLDIASVTYRNTTPSVSARVRVAKLTQAGRAELYITTTGGTDVANVALVSSRSDGTLRKRFVQRGNLGDTNLKCKFEALWNTNKSFIRVAVPRRCLTKAGAGAHYMRVDMTAIDTGERDYAPAAHHLARD